jgi:hypothetical protein
LILIHNKNVSISRASHVPYNNIDICNNIIAEKSDNSYNQNDQIEKVEKNIVNNKSDVITTENINLNTCDDKIKKVVKSNTKK